MPRPARLLPPAARVLVAVPAVGLAVLAGGCGTTPAAAGGTAPSPATIAPASPGALERVRAAARATLSTSAAVSIQLDAAAVFGARPRPVQGSGRFDFAGDRGSAELSQPTGTERAVFLPESVFVAQPGATGVLPAGKSWISAGLTEQSPATNFPQFVTQVESLNPVLVVSEVAWGATSAAPAAPSGKGVTSAYAVTVDLAKAQSAATGPAGQAFRRAIGYQLAEMSGAAAPTSITVYVGVGSGGKIAALGDAPAGAGVGTVSMYLSDFGTAVQVDQPPKVQVADISSLAPGGEQENAGGGDPDGA